MQPELDSRYFGPLAPFVEDPEVTDIDYNGREIWLTGSDNQRRQLDPDFTKEKMTRAFVEQFSNRIANRISRQFNPQNPVLEAETPDLRVTILHESVARSGRSISIRKTPPLIRLTKERAMEEDFASEDLLNFMVNSVQIGANIVFCGIPGAGKTESLKFFSAFIPSDQRVITIEDTLELRYPVTNPGKDCIELKVKDEIFSYTDAIKASLRLNPRWLMLSEARSREVKYLLEAWSTGICGMTTLHTDDVQNIPDRILSMLESRQDANRMEKEIFESIDIGVLLQKKKTDSGQIRRYMDQVCLFDRSHGKNRILMLVENGRFVGEQELPQKLKNRFLRAGITDPFTRPLVLAEEVSKA